VVIHKSTLVLLFWTLLLSLSYGQKPVSRALTITVKDENGVAVPGARVALIAPDYPTLKVEADYAGKVQLQSLASGSYQLRVERENFYAVTVPDIKVPESAAVQVTLHHVREYHENVEVTDSPPAVELAQTSSREQLTNREIFSLPYPVTRDFRQVLPFIPQVLLDNNQQLHIAGSADHEIYEQLDGFELSF
jgi:hypothetical protein